MDELLEKIHNYFSSNPDWDGIWAAHCAYLVTEFSIPRTSKAFKKETLSELNGMLKANVFFKLFVNTFVKSFSSVPIEVLDEYNKYYKEEKDCIHNIKKLVKSNVVLEGDMPKMAYCKMLSSAVLLVRNENLNKIKNAANLYKQVEDGVNVTFDIETVSPVNKSLVKKISTDCSRRVQK